MSLSHFLIDRFDPDTNLLHPSKAQFLKAPSKLATLILRIFSALGLTDLTLHSGNGQILEATNLTMLNFLLVRFGSMTEKRLVQLLMVTQVSVIRINVTKSPEFRDKQVSGSVLAFVVRYGLAGLVYDGDRR